MPGQTRPVRNAVRTGPEQVAIIARGSSLRGRRPHPRERVTAEPVDWRPTGS